MMTKLRESTGIIMWIVIVAFVGLIVVEWGADYSGTSGASQSDAVGVINGREVSLKQFQQALRNAANQRSREERGDDGSLVREVWDAMVSEAIITRELERLGIEVSDEDLAHYTLNAPPEAVQQIEVFQTDGAFDPNLYQQFLSAAATFDEPSNRSFVLQIERMIESQLLNHRLQKMLMETVRVSGPEVRQSYIDRNAKVTVEYVFSPAAAISDDEVDPNDEAIQAHYNDTVDDYRHGEQIRPAHVEFPKIPNAADSADVADHIRRLHSEIQEGGDFDELARALSEDEGSAPSGGDLGTFGRGRMVPPFEEAVFALEVGALSEPVRTRFGWHLIKLDERLEEEGEEKLRARHILLKFTPSPDTQDSLQMVATTFRDLVVERGIEAAAEIEGIQIRDPGFIAAGRQIPGLGTGTAWVVNLFFNSEIGAVSPVGNSDRSYWVAQLAATRPEGAAPLEEVRTAVERSLLARLKAERAGAALREIRQKVQAGADLSVAAAAAGLEARTSDPVAREDYVPDVGRANAFLAAAFELQNTGDLSDIVVEGNGSYLIRLVEKSPIDEERFLDARAGLHAEVLRERQTEALQVWFAQLYQAAEIEDNRHLFYTF